MNHISDLDTHIRSLLPHSGPEWDSGPFTEEEVRRVEKQIGRPLEPDHRQTLLVVGGCFLFQAGARVPDTDHEVTAFMGPDKQHYSIDKKWDGYRGQIPQAWYPFADDSSGHFFCLSGDNAVYYVFLKEELLARNQRPETSGDRIADSFYEFVMSLYLPDWAHELTPHPRALYDLRGQRVPRRRRRED
ncbi:MAG: hypothetical protein Tsb0020_35000 [Haliangiales bacterium]